MSQPTCADLVSTQWDKTREALQAFQNDDLTNEEGNTLGEYGLDFSFVEPDTFDDQPVGYWRYQISWGGPADEIRYHLDADRSHGLKVEYWYLNWFDGASTHLKDDDKELAMWVFDLLAPPAEPPQNWFDF